MCGSLLLTSLVQRGPISASARRAMLERPTRILRAKVVCRPIPTKVNQDKRSSSSSAKNDATLIVAQRSPAGGAPSPGRGLGEWSYRLTTADGTDLEWLMHGSCLEDHLDFPETTYNSISYTLEGNSSHRSLAVRLEKSSLGSREVSEGRLARVTRRSDSLTGPWKA